MNIFLAQFLTIYLLGLQQRNVIGSHYMLAFLTSLILGVNGWYLNSIIATANLAAIGTAIWWCFIVAGPLAIVCAMKTHPWIVSKFYRR